MRLFEVSFISSLALPAYNGDHGGVDGALAFGKGELLYGADDIRVNLFDPALHCGAVPVAMGISSVERLYGF